MFWYTIARHFRYKAQLDSGYVHDYVEYPSVALSRVKALVDSASGADPADLKLLVSSLGALMKDYLGGANIVRERRRAWRVAALHTRLAPSSTCPSVLC